MSLLANTIVIRLMKSRFDDFLIRTDQYIEN